MSITVGRYSFEGPYTSTGSLEDRSGVYAIHDYRDGLYYLIDVGESATLKSRVENHDRAPCWNGNKRGTLTVSAFYTPHLQQSGRQEIESEIRNQYDPPCGLR